MSKSRPISSFPFCSVHKTKLDQAGFRCVQDLANLTPDQLITLIDVTVLEAEEILRQINEYRKVVESSEAIQVGRLFNQQKQRRSETSLASSLGGISALDLLKKEKTAKKIITFSRNIDEMLEGGVHVGKTTEICGSPGIGKTQLCMQLCVDATIPSLFGGADGEAIYIDTEGSFVSERIAQIATSTAAHIKALASNNDSTLAMPTYSMEYILSKIHYYRCHTHLQLIALTNILDSFLSDHPSVCLLVVDSIASPFRHGFRDLSHRNRLLSGLSQTLIKLALEFELAVVLTNQMTTRSTPVSSSSTGTNMTGNTHLVPALGESWGHASTTRVMLYWEDGDRHAFLFKSPSCKERRATFQVTVDGIRDVPTIIPEGGCVTPDQHDTTRIPPIVSTQSIGETTDGNIHDTEEELDHFFENVSMCLDRLESADSAPSNKRQRTH